MKTLIIIVNFFFSFFGISNVRCSYAIEYSNNLASIYDYHHGLVVNMLHFLSSNCCCCCLSLSHNWIINNKNKNFIAASIGDPLNKNKNFISFFFSLNLRYSLTQLKYTIFVIVH